jgi:hypothetical protein
MYWSYTHADQYLTRPWQKCLERQSQLSRGASRAGAGRQFASAALRQLAVKLYLPCDGLPENHQK